MGIQLEEILTRLLETALPASAHSQQVQLASDADDVHASPGEHGGAEG